jgi:hypothetical protein
LSGLLHWKWTSSAWSYILSGRRFSTLPSDYERPPSIKAFPIAESSDHFGSKLSEIVGKQGPM